MDEGGARGITRREMKRAASSRNRGRARELEEGVGRVPACREKHWRAERREGEGAVGATRESGRGEMGRAEKKELGGGRTFEEPRGGGCRKDQQGRRRDRAGDEIFPFLISFLFNQKSQIFLNPDF
jgi:hypothetical protein